MIRKLLPAAVVVLCAVALGGPTAALPSPEPAIVVEQPPNVVLLMIDDATVEDIEYMPNVQRLLVQQGTTFTRNYSPYPVCCPARATVLTGQYAHNHRVLDNVAPLGGASVFDDSATIATYITDDYDTAIIDKYLNDFDNDYYVAPGWDTWRVPVKKTTYNYASQVLSFYGRLKRFDTYMTHQYGKAARGFIDQADEPYFAYVSFVAPHVGWPHETPDDPYSPFVEKKYRDTYAGSPLPSDPSINEADMSDKRQAMQSRPVLGAAEIADIEERLAQRRESLRSVDDEIAAVVRKVTATGQLDNTYFIFVSDNGSLEGQHRISIGKGAAYEPASRVPLIIRGPDFPAGATYDDVTGLQDLTPTILDMTRQRHDQRVDQIDGISLVKLFRGSVTTDRAQVIEVSETADVTDTQIERGATPSRTEAQRLSSGRVVWNMRGIVTSAGWKYTKYPQTGEVEMYDLNTDPYEEQNLAGLPGYQAEQTRLRDIYQQYRSCEGASCR